MCLQSLGAWFSVVSCFACWLMDFCCVVVWNFWRRCFPGGGFKGSMRLSSDFDFGVRKVAWGSQSFRFLLLLAGMCRIGEASLPGPRWSVGTCNPAGLLHKGHLVPSEVDLWAVSETHLSISGYRQFMGGLRNEQSSFAWCVQGHPVPCRSSLSVVGSWSGVALLSKWPCRALPTSWCLSIYATSCLVCGASLIHDVWVTGVVMYGTPAGPTHPRARETTDSLLRMAVQRVGQSHGPRFVAGDWNHDLGALSAVDELLALGFVEAQDLHYQRCGVLPKPTCRLKTRRDFLFLSPEMQWIFTGCEVFHDHWPDHSSVVACFDGGASDLVRYPWPTPFPINWADYPGRGDGSFFDFSSGDCTGIYTQLWADVESVVQVEAVKKAQMLPRACFGRAARLSPLVVKGQPPPVRRGRPGDPQPLYYGSSKVHGQMFRQVRRLHSYVRLAGGSSLSLDRERHCIDLWTSILGANGFRPSFMQWWIDCGFHTSLVELPSDPPELEVAVLVFQKVDEATRQFEKALCRQKAYCRKIRTGHDMKHVYASVRRDPPEPVEVLLQARSAEVACVNHDDVSVELVQDTDWFEESPFFHQGRQLPVIYATPDRVWFDDVGGIRPGDQVIQSRAVGNLDAMFAAFISQWTQRWGRHANIPHSQWDAILDFARGRFRPINAAPLEWSAGLIKSSLNSKKKRTACGVDGVSMDDLLSLRHPQLASIVSMYERAEEEGCWPQQLLVGAVRSLAKTSCPGDVNDYRPVTVLGLLYRLWGSLQSRHWMAHLDSVLDPMMHGSRRGSRAAHVWRHILNEVEWAHLSNSSMAGITLDLTKAFNCLPRYPTLGVARLLGVGHSALVGWAGALAQLERCFVIRGSFSDPVASSCGFPEGDSLSCLAMVCVDQVFHTWMTASQVMCSPISYVDNWELLLESADSAVAALDRAMDFARQWDLQFDRKKTFAWGTDCVSRRTLRSCGFTVKSDVKDLGAHLVFTRQLRNRTVLERIGSLSDFWSKLTSARGTLPQKLRAVKTAAWPRALHGVSAVVVGKKHWFSLRSAYMRSFRWAKPGANPFVQMLLDGFGADPQLFAIWNTILDYRSLGGSGLAQLSWGLVGADGFRSAQATVSEVLCHRVHQLGWAVVSENLVSDGFGSFDLVRCNMAELKYRVSWAWLRYVATQVADRLDFDHFSSVHVEATIAGVRKFPIQDQAALRAVLNGTTFTNRHAYHWSDSGDLGCPACGQEDSLHHKYWGCSLIQDLLDCVPSSTVALVPELPSCVADRGWSLCPGLLVALRKALCGLDDEVRFQCDVMPCAGVLDVFTDGSCFFSHDRDVRLAAWAVCVSESGPCDLQGSFRVLASSPLNGLVQSAYRAELFSLQVALQYARDRGCGIRVWTDCKGVQARFKWLTSGGKLNINGPHSDLWSMVLDHVEAIGLSRVCVAKVTAHVNRHEVDLDIEAWLARGNGAADMAAKSANKDRGDRFWMLWQAAVDEVCRSRVVSEQIRDHLVAVNRRWYQFSVGEPARPECPVVKQAKEQVMKWVVDEQLERPLARFGKLFGLTIAGMMEQWWGSLIDPAGEVQWISYAQLYIDWQLEMAHPGPLKIQGKWYDGGQFGVTPESFTFRQRSKWFRLCVQQWARDLNISFAKVTTRPSSVWLACHIGAASIPILQSRRLRCEEWLRQRLTAPVVGLGEHLDCLPPAWG